MKKTVIALAVAAVSAPMMAQADVTLYGQLHEVLLIEDGADASLENAGHRIGIKGSNELNGGLSSFFKFETELKNDKDKGTEESTGSTDAADFVIRQAHAGVKGGFGSIAVGRQSNPYTAVYKADIYEEFSGVFQEAPSRNGTSLRYDSPDMGGFSLQTSLILEGEGDDAQEDLDGFSVVANFAVADFDVSVGHYAESYGGNDTLAVTGLGVGYTIGSVAVSASYETDAEGTENTNVDLFASYSLNDATSVGLGYAQSDYDANTADAATQIVLGAYHGLGGNSDVYTEVAIQNDGADGSDDVTDFAMGYRVKF